MIKIGKAVEIVDEIAESGLVITYVYVNKIRVGAIQKIEMIWDSTKDPIKRIFICAFGDKSTKDMQCKLAAELLKDGFDIHWIKFGETSRASESPAKIRGQDPAIFLSKLRSAEKNNF